MILGSLNLSLACAGTVDPGCGTIGAVSVVGRETDTGFWARFNLVFETPDHLS
jgi:hypothetical protein